MGDLTDKQWRHFAHVRARAGSKAAHRYANGIRRARLSANLTRDAGLRMPRVDAAYSALTHSVMRTVAVWVVAYFIAGPTAAYAMGTIMVAVGAVLTAASYMAGDVL